MAPTAMKAAVVIKGCYVDPNAPADNATLSLEFCATDDPRSGSIEVSVSLLQSETQIAVDIKTAVVDYINQSRGSVVIAAADVRLP